MTDLLYLPDADGVTEFSATVTEATEEYVVLEGTYSPVASATVAENSVTPSASGRYSRSVIGHG